MFLLYVKGVSDKLAQIGMCLIDSMSRANMIGADDAAFTCARITDTGNTKGSTICSYVYS